MQQSAGDGWIDRVAMVMLIGAVLSFLGFIALWLLVIFGGVIV